MAPRRPLSECHHYTFGVEYEEIHQEAIAEVMGLIPGEKRARLGSYGLSSPCRYLSKVILSGLICQFMNWALHNRVVFKDYDEPWRRPETFQLESGKTLWPPSDDRTVLLVPLNLAMVEVDVLHRGRNTGVLFQWQPTMVLHITEMGVRARGPGTIRFIYILMSLDRDAERFFLPLQKK